MPDIGKLQRLYASDQDSRRILEYLAGRKNRSALTTADRLEEAMRAQGQDLTRNSTVRFFKQLEEAGCGRFIVGRKRKPTRFIWTCSLVDVGTAAKGESSQITEIPEAELYTETDDDDVESADPESEAATERETLLQHRFHLRPDFEVTVRLPVDLTGSEATRFADFVRSLPFQ